MSSQVILRSSIHERLGLVGVVSTAIEAKAFNCVLGKVFVCLEGKNFGYLLAVVSAAPTESQVDATAGIFPREFCRAWTGTHTTSHHSPEVRRNCGRWLSRWEAPAPLACPPSTSCRVAR